MFTFSAVLLMAVVVAEPTQTQITQATQVADASNSLIQKTPVGSDSMYAGTVIEPLVVGLEAVDPFFAVIGMVSTLFGFFDNSTKLILEQLQFIENQIAYIESDMQNYFNELMDEVQQQRCFSEYSSYELKIRVAYKKFLLFIQNQDQPDAIRNNYLNSFLQECNNSVCTDAAFAIGQTLSGSTGLMGCDMLAILYEGIAGTNLYFKGYQDMLMDKASYLLTLMNMGIIVTSAHDTLSAAPEGQEYAYMVT